MLQWTVNWSGTLNRPIKEQQGWSRQPINPQLKGEGYRVPIIPFIVHPHLATGLQQTHTHMHRHFTPFRTLFLNQWLHCVAVDGLCLYQWMQLLQTRNLWVGFSFEVYFTAPSKSLFGCGNIWPSINCWPPFSRHLCCLLNYKLSCKNGDLSLPLPLLVIPFHVVSLPPPPLFKYSC